jgi:integrase/recombinase XerC
LSVRTIEDTYKCYLNLSCDVIGLDITGDDINRFIKSRKCSDGGKHAYYGVIRNFYNWLYSRKSGFDLARDENPILDADAPKVEKKILPSLTLEQVEEIISQAKCIRDKAIVSLFVDSGLRLSEMANIDSRNINWENRTIKVKIKGKREGLAPFGSRTETLLRQWLLEYNAKGLLWDINDNGIKTILRRLSERSGIVFTAHVFRRTFASILAKRNVDSLHIMRLGRWSSVAMVERYTRSVRFEDSLKLYNDIVD